MLTKTDPHIYLYAMLRHRKVKIDTKKILNPYNGIIKQWSVRTQIHYKPPKCNTEPERQTSMTSVT